MTNHIPKPLEKRLARNEIETVLLEMKQKKIGYYIQNRINLIKKIDKNKDYKPTNKELNETYGYLDYCLDCEKQIKFGEPISHCFFGNRHRFGCSTLKRIFGYIYHLTMRILRLPILIIIIPFYFGWKFIKKLWGKLFFCEEWNYR